MNFKIHETIDTMCVKCEHSIVTKTIKGTLILCNYGTLPKNIPPVLECSVYQAKGSMDIYDMEKKAWVLEVKGREIIGFRQPKKRKD